MVLPSVIVCFLIYSLVFAVFSYRDQKRSIIDKLENHARIQSAILAKSLWELNFEVTRAQIESILLNPELSGILVSESTTDTVIAVGSLPQAFPDDDYFSIESEIVFNAHTGRQKVGTLILASRKNLTVIPLLQSILRDTILMFFLVLAIVASALVANRTIMNVPLNRLLESIRRADEEQIREPVDWHAGDELGRVITAYNDLLQTLNVAEEELKNSEERFRSLVDVSSDWIWEIDRNGAFTYASSKVADLLGYEPEEVIGKRIFDLLLAEPSTREEQRFREALSTQKPFRNLEMTLRHRDQSPVTVETSGIPVFDSSGELSGYRGIDRDITERKRIQEMMIQSEKMLSIGGLAAGMAHEINNPLAGILQSIQVIKNRISKATAKNNDVAQALGTTMDAIRTYHEKRRIFEMLEAATQSGYRAAKIVDNMLSFSRKQPTSKDPALLSELLDSTVELAENDYDLKKKQDFRQIEIVREYPEIEPPVLCERSKIQQVFLNILKNGSEAMSEALIENPRFILRLIPDDKMVSVEIEDNGPGMDETVRKRIFEPFFTTKDVGIGTGLGLSVSYYIVTDDHDGTMNVESTLGHGSRFVIRLPQSAPA